VAATAASLEGTVAMTDVLDTAITVGADYRGPSAQAWFAVGERVGYDPKARAIVDAQDAPLKTFLKREGEVSHAVTFLPGYPDGSFGWAKVRPHLPNAAEMSKLFVEYVGMGDSDKPKDYAYSTAVALLSGCLARGSSRRSRSLRSTTSA
jgi:pimeloyl-ACP methyl ester carboxylesterase